VEAGTVLAGRYRLEERLGRGGMGEVWRADDPGLGRHVAIKIVLSDLDSDPALIARLRQEATNAAKLQHPGITVVHDVGDHEGHPFFVMEFLDGQDLKAVLDQHPGGLPIDQVTSIARQVAAALAHAHAKGVVHRDIKPANLMVLTDGGVKICDFGISRYADATSGLTTDGRVLGTPAYMAPEQYKGQRADARTDLYSLGCTLYAMLTGGPPFPTGHQWAALMYQHLDTPPPSPSSTRPDIPLELEELVLDLLAKEPDDRPASASMVVARLHPLADSAPQQSVPPTSPEPTLQIHSLPVTPPRQTADLAAETRPLTSDHAEFKSGTAHGMGTTVIALALALALALAFFTDAATTGTGGPVVTGAVLFVLAFLIAVREWAGRGRLIINTEGLKNHVGNRHQDVHWDQIEKISVIHGRLMIWFRPDAQLPGWVNAAWARRLRFAGAYKIISPPASGWFLSEVSTALDRYAGPLWKP
jgi:tRNA A-37 threonylcarbamoyl transferase component Bud32